MSKTPEKVVVNNLLFALCDTLEVLMLESEKLYRIDNQEFRHEAKQNFKKTLFHLRKFLSYVRDCSLETQIEFGNSSDELKELLLLFIDRTNGEDVRINLFMKYLYNCSSLLEFNFSKVGIDFNKLK